MTLVTISSKNQITIPALYLRQFDMKPQGKFLVDRKDGGLFLKPIRWSIVDELVGSLTKFIPKNKRYVPVEKAIRAAKILHASELMKKLNNDSG